jgi:hypothetical protein
LRNIVVRRDNFTFSLCETGRWRAVCEKTTCTVRREGRVTPAPTPTSSHQRCPAVTGKTRGHRPRLQSSRATS